MMAAARGAVPISDLQKFLDTCADMDDARCGEYTLYHEFYDGRRGAKLRDRAKEYLELYGVAFCENFVEPAVDAVAERLKVIGFVSSLAETDEQTDKVTDPVGGQLETWWQESRMDVQQGVIHTNALIQGEEFVIVDFDVDNDRPRITRQLPHQIRVWYSDDEPDTIEYASKLWSTTRSGPQNPNGRRVQRLNVYWPDQVWKYYRPHRGDSSGRGGWERWSDDGDAGWPTPWVDQQGSPFGVAVIHFRNKPLGSTVGRSRVRPVIPFQEQLNKYVADLNDLVDSHALPQDWATGVSNGASLRRVPGDLWTTPSADAKFGRLAATEAKSVLEPIEGVLSRMARRSRVPMHLLTGGTPPSGESLKTSESGLIAIATDCQTSFGQAWEQAELMMIRLAVAFTKDADAKKNLTVPDDRSLLVDVQWANAETRSDTDDLAVAEAKKRLGVSQRTLLAELGYDPEKEEQRRNDEQAAAAEVLGKALGSPGFGD